MRNNQSKMNNLRSTYRWSARSGKAVLVWGLVCITCFLVTINVSAQHSAAPTFKSETDDAVAKRLQSTILADALLQLAESRQLELVYAPELLAGKTTDCPELPVEDEAAVRCLLKKSGLMATRLKNGVFIIRKPAGTHPGYFGGIKGSVTSYESGVALANAHIIVTGTSYSTTSGKTGAFHIERMPPGLYDVQVSVVGYESTSFPQLHVVAGQSLAIDLKLKEATIPLEEVLITSKNGRKGISLPDTLDPLAYQGFNIGRLSAGLFMSSSASTVEGLQLGGLGSMARDSLRGVQFAGVFNSAQTAKGVQFGGVFNTVLDDLDGYQFSGVLNQLGGDLEGGQFGGVVNTAAGVRGTQFAGVANLADGNALGVQAAGVTNVVANMRGIQMAGVANRANRKRGMQGAGVLNMASELSGLQAAGVANIVQGDFRGAQFAGVVNVGGDSRRGVQIAGVVNVAGDIGRGVQIGLVNFARHNDGLPLGVFSFVRETGLRFDGWVDEQGMISTAVRSGNRKFANYIGVAALTDASIDQGAVLMGLGGEFTFGPRFFATLDAFYYLFGLETSRFDEHMTRGRFQLGFKVAPRIALLAGPSLNLFLSDNPESTFSIPSRVIEAGTWGSTNYDFWAGFNVGLRISTKP